MNKTATSSPVFSILLAMIILIPCIFLWPAFNRFVLVKQVAMNVLAAVAVLFLIFRSRTIQVRLPFWTLPFYMFCFGAIILSIFSAQPLFAMMNVGLLMMYGIFGILLFNTLTPQRIKELIDVLLYVTAVVSMIGIFQFLGIIPTGDIPGKWKVFSTFGNPTFLGAFLVGVLPLSIYNVLHKKDLTSYILAIIPAICLVCTFARASWISMLVIAAVWTLVSRKIQLRSIVLTLLILVIVITGIVSARPDFKKHLLNWDSMKGRYFLWTLGLDMFRDHWATGVGLGQFRLHHLQYQYQKLKAHPELVPRFSPFAPVEEFCHNDYIQIVAETGIIGILFLYCVLCAMCRILLRHARSPRSFEFSCTLGILALLINALFFFPFYVPPTLLLFFILLTLISTKEKDIRTLKLNTLTTGTLAVVMLVVIALSIVTLTADIELNAGFTALENGDTARSTAFFQAAHCLNPWSGEIRYFMGRNYFVKKEYQNAQMFLEQALPSYRNYYVYSLLGFVYNIRALVEQYELTLQFLHTALPGQRITDHYGLAVE